MEIFDVLSRSHKNIPVSLKENYNELLFEFNCEQLRAGNYYYLLKEDGEAIATAAFQVQ